MLSLIAVLQQQRTVIVGTIQSISRQKTSECANTTTSLCLAAHSIRKQSRPLFRWLRLFANDVDNRRFGTAASPIGRSKAGSHAIYIGLYFAIKQNAIKEQEAKLRLGQPTVYCHTLAQQT